MKALGGHRMGAWILPALIIFSAIGTPRGALAEDIDRIVAVVGNEIILLSELDEEVYMAHLRDELDLQDAASVHSYRATVLDALVEAKLLLATARREGLRATREEVDRAVESMIRDVRSRFPDEAAFERQLASEGSSLEKLRKGYRSKLDEQIVVRQLVDRNVRSRVTVTESDARAYWDAHRDQIPPVPSLLHLRRILVSMNGSAAMDSAAIERAGIVLRRIDAGEDFGTLARVFSEGPAAAKGGDLGWFQSDDLEPLLGNALRGLKAGETTPVVVTSRGAHIIRVDDVREDGAQRLRQIIFLRDEAAARASARARAESIHRRLREGADFATIAETESDDPTTAPRGGDLGDVPAEALSPEYRARLEPLAEGELTDVIEDKDAFVIFRLDGRTGERPATFDEMRDRIMEILQQEKGKVFYDELLAVAREKTYVELRLESDG